MSTSVIIPVRNRPTLVAAAVASLQKQTLPVQEILVVDDASTDETPEIVAELARRDDRVRLLKLPERHGASHARNVGIRHTEADWVGFLDSDDEWLPEKHFLQQQRLTEVPGSVASFTGIRYVLPNGSKDQPLPAKLAPPALRRMNFLGSTSTALVRREALLAVDGFDDALPSCQDWDLWLRLERQGAFALVQSPQVLYSQVETGRISRNIDNVIRGHEIVFARALAGAPRGEIRAIRAWHQARLAQIRLWDFDDPGAAARACLKSIGFRPTTYALRLLIWSLQASAKHMVDAKGQTPTIGTPQG